MYHALLANRYLTSRVIPLIAVAAVALCVALVIVVVSVMTGFLDMVKSSGRTLMGDVVVAYPVSGIPYYERLIKDIEALPEAEAATPVVDSWGLLRMPYPDGDDKQIETVQIWGIEPVGFARVTGYRDTLHWKQTTDNQWKWIFSDAVDRAWPDVLELLNDDQQLELLKETLTLENPQVANPPSENMLRQRLATLTDSQWQSVFTLLRSEPEILQRVLTEEQWNALLAEDARLMAPDTILAQGLSLKRGDVPGIVMGMHVSEGNNRQSDGSYRPAAMGYWNQYWWMPRFDVTLTAVPITGGGLSTKTESRILPVVNEFVSGVFLIDDKRVMVPLDVGQSMLHLDASEIMDDDDPTKVTGIDPPRATMVLVRAAEGVTPVQLRNAVADTYDRFVDKMALDPEADIFPPTREIGLVIQTWEQQQAAFIGPVEKERELMRTLFSIVYIVCAALVLSIFWAIVYEKTRDIGILRSVGASRGGIIWIFLRYGLVVGVIGSIVGLGLALLIVRNINHIHDALADPPLTMALVILAAAVGIILLTILLGRRGQLLPILVGSLTTIGLLVLGFGIIVLRNQGGLVIWDPAVYYFTEIPSQMDVTTAVTTMIGAVVFSLLGAAVPAAKAADIDPVAALRYE